MEDQDAVNPTRRRLIGGMGLAGAAAVLGGSQLAQFTLGSTPAFAQEAKPLKVAVVAQQMAAQSDQRSWDGLQQWLKKTGLDKTWHITQTDAKGDPGQLVSQIEDAITAKSDAILVMYGTLTAAKSALDSLTSSKIPFFSLDSGWQAPAIADITSNNYAMSAQTVQFMIDTLLAKGKTSANICAIVANFHHGTRKRGKVMKTALTENEWISLKAERVIQYSGFYETTQNTVSDWLTTYGEDLDVIWCPWDEPAMAAAEVIAARGLQDKIFVIGHDGHPTALDRMRKPDYPLLATTAQAFEVWGAYTGWLINEIVGKGGDVKKLVPVPTVEFPAPLLVKGVNIPPAGTPTYNAQDLYYIYRDRALAGM
ncbi:sugar ABC transporter substrate-binding protein [Labrys wisconsinensis]|uniref:Ribose transport system substrate-binding protein n=1 Tax=Labrys wisconsinensis TaxID=425677 RepID=A0ABU0JJM5_9HYPH|nr:sugar ABC transporter substrate-binding protein [Labrys wisconsinensis]MDQ0474485.1 ribose transport system substrate-binding protein [Labrys wisconsinensis]